MCYSVFELTETLPSFCCPLQKARLAECERMLVALDLALWLNDNSAALQAVVGCYGLLAPLIYHQIPSGEVLQVAAKSKHIFLRHSVTLLKAWEKKWIPGLTLSHPQPHRSHHN